MTIDNETNRLATGGLDKRIIVWDLNNPSNRQKLEGHLKGVWCLNFLTRFLLCSGSFDATLKSNIIKISESKLSQRNIIRLFF